MEILLLEDINGIGKKNDLLVVGDGFALNHLLPARKALVATPTVRKRYADQIRKRAEEKENERQVQLQAASLLQGKSVQLARKVTKTGKLYAAVSEEDIVKALDEQHQIRLPADSVSLSQQIKAVGTFTVQVKLGEKPQNLNVIITALVEATARKKEKEKVA